jgi:hypothetical protein
MLMALQWNDQEEARMYFQEIIGEVRTCMERTNETVEKAVEELEALYCAELLDLLQKVAEKKFKNNKIIQAIITKKIASLEEKSSALHAEIRARIEESGSNKGWKEANRRIRQGLTTKRWTQKFKGVISHSLPSFKERGASTSAIPASSSASSSRAMLMGGHSRSTTPTPSLNSTDYEASSQGLFPPVSGREQLPDINETTANRVDELPSSLEVGHELDYQSICASSERLSTYISAELVSEFLQTIRSAMTNLADTHHIEKVYNSTILGMITEYEEVLRKEDDQRPRAPEDQRARSTLAQLQLWANITAAVSAIDALSKAREAARQKPTDIRSREFSPL